MATNGYNRNYNRNYRSSNAYARRKRRNRRRLRNRIIIVSGFAIIVLLIILLFTFIIKSCSAGSGETAAGSGSNSSASAQQPEDNGSGAVLRENGVLVWNNAAFEPFEGNSDCTAAYANALNNFKTLSGFELYSAIIPSHTEIALPQRLKSAEGFKCTSQADNISAAYSRLASDIVSVDCCNTLSQHSGEYIYFNSDSRCTALGAYYAYEAFAKKAGLQVLSLDSCKEEKIKGYRGSLFSDGVNEDTVSYFTLPYNASMEITAKGKREGYESPYCTDEKSPGVFLKGDNPLTVLKSENGGGKIALVKDGCANALAPYLTYDYQEVHIIDFRYWEGSLMEYCSENGIDSVLFVNGAASVNDGMQVKALEAVLK